MLETFERNIGKDFFQWMKCCWVLNIVVSYASQVSPYIPKFAVQEQAHNVNDCLLKEIAMVKLRPGC